VGEGDVNLEEVLRAVQARAKAEFPELAALELVPPKSTPAPIQPVISQPPPPPPPPPSSPPPPVPPPSEVRPLEPPPVEQKPVFEPWPSAETPPPPPPPLPPPLPPPRQITAVVKLVLGRPDNCGECAYFGSMTSRCFLFGFAVTNPASPPCKQYVRSGG